MTSELQPEIRKIAKTDELSLNTLTPSNGIHLQKNVVPGASR